MTIVRLVNVRLLPRITQVLFFQPSWLAFLRKDQEGKVGRVIAMIDFVRADRRFQLLNSGDGSFLLGRIQVIENAHTGDAGEDHNDGGDDEDFHQRKGGPVCASRGGSGLSPTQDHGGTLSSE